MSTLSTNFLEDTNPIAAVDVEPTLNEDDDEPKPASLTELVAPGGAPIDPETGEPYYVAAFERLMAEGNVEEERRKRLLRLRRLGRPEARRRSYPLDVGEQVGASPPLSARLPRWLDEQIRREFEGLGISHSTGVRQILEEWWVTRRYPALEFRGTEFIRSACIRGGPSVQQWADSGSPPDLAPDVREQVLDYIQLFKNRLRTGHAR